MRNLEAKKQLRAKLKQLRDVLSKEEQSDLSYCITEKVVSHYDFGRAKNILIYMHYNSEVQTDGIILYAFMLGKRVFIPKVEGSEMNFYEIRDLKECVNGFRGIPEPPQSAEIFQLSADRPKDETLVILPGLGFDKECKRIGYGGGYYDKYLAANPNCMKMAIGYDMQCIDHVPVEETDISMDIIITDEQIILPDGEE